MRFEDCVRKGFIKEDRKAVERVESSLKIADRFLKSAKKNIEIGEYEMAEIVASGITYLKCLTQVLDQK